MTEFFLLICEIDWHSSSFPVLLLVRWVMDSVLTVKVIKLNRWQNDFGTIFHQVELSIFGPITCNTT